MNCKVIHGDKMTKALEKMKDSSRFGGAKPFARSGLLEKLQ